MPKAFLGCFAKKMSKMVAWYKMSNFILAVDHSFVIFNIQIKKSCNPQIKLL
jgi:hypothetical protein